MNRISKFMWVIVCLCVNVTVVRAEESCSLQTFTGTYVISERGSSVIMDPSSAPFPLHWAGATAPFVAIGEVTFGQDGIGKGFYWIRVGSFNSGLDPIPVEVTITELNPDCTGKWQFPFSLLGTTFTIEERFIIFDHGQQARSVPIVTGLPTVTWVGEHHRISKSAEHFWISKPGEPLNICGRHTVHGSYLFAVENMVRPGLTTPILSDALLLRMDISMNGDYTGKLYEKLGPTGNIVLPVSGTMAVNRDCSFATDLIIDFGSEGTVKAPLRGVLFDQGKRAVGLNMNTNPTGTQFSYGEGVRMDR